MEYLKSDEIKSVLINSLYKLDQFLEKNSIKYSIMSGTMLGCIRHGGFIPWDDDIDIALLRSEYEKLIKILKRNSGLIYDGIFASGMELGNGKWPFLKICVNDILVQENTVSQPEYLWIDIFPFDGVPSKNFDLYFKYIMFLRRIYYYRRNDVIVNQKDLIPKKIIEFATKFISDEFYVNYYIKECSKYDCNSMEKVADLTWGKKSIPRKLFDDIIEYKFENIMVKGFRDYDTYLKCIYGDYMKLPPENERVNHGIKAWRAENEK